MHKYGSLIRATDLVGLNFENAVTINSKQLDV
jgi:hypothetical protein